MKKLKYKLIQKNNIMHTSNFFVANEGSRKDEDNV